MSFKEVLRASRKRRGHGEAFIEERKLGLDLERCAVSLGGRKRTF